MTLGSISEVIGLASACNSIAAHQAVKVSYRADGGRFFVFYGYAEELFCPKDDLYSVESHEIEISATADQSL